MGPPVIQGKTGRWTLAVLLLLAAAVFAGFGARDLGEGETFHGLVRFVIAAGDVAMAGGLLSALRRG